MNAKKRPKNTLTEVLTLLLCLALLTGCGAQAASNAAETPALSTGGAAGTAGSAAPLWQASFLSLEDDSLYGMPGAMCADGETLYFTSNGVLEDATPEGVEPEWPEQYLVYGPVIVKADLNGNRQIVPYKPESRLETSEPNRGILFEQICAGGDDTLWVIENHFCGGAPLPQPHPDRRHGAGNDPAGLSVGLRSGRDQRRKLHADGGRHGLRREGRALSGRP